MPLGNMGGWTFVIILVIILLLFGAPRLPQLAKSLGESMRIFKGEMKTMKNDSDASAPSASSTTEPSQRNTTPNDPTSPDITNRSSTDSASDGNDTSAR